MNRVTMVRLAWLTDRKLVNGNLLKQTAEFKELPADLLERARLGLDGGPG
ncbi:hypothetical protein GCM10007160_21640 [Litchfieldella qijiaojingensis]|uniref:Uncharacterized protein n=1 Tax=Litchfieldella qijiaojingensis TaxID=980347 RepID=A0ABQ2YSG7_9GAMM|nr:hypothetical protein [Halomonas qijiaojingensis]GGX93862.1 hypothetical protein GCM10007160_21640 [Halomonas qijiaojingensis]